MEAILLPGESEQSKGWVESLQEMCREDFSETDILYYSHWDVSDDSEAIMDIELEAQKLAQLVRGKKRYRLFAKSAGVIVALQAIQNYDIRPQKCIFAGTPVHWAKKNDFEVGELVDSLTIPITFIQKTDDPVGSYALLREIVESAELPKKQFIEVAGQNHDYTDIDFLVKEELRA